MKSPINQVLILTAVAAIFLSCFDNTEEYEKLSGEWKCVSWINKQRDIDLCDESIYFHFEMDKQYTSVLGEERDTGTYKIIDQMLYVNPKGKQEFSVRLKSLRQDTTVFQMNSAGEEEVLTLYRVSEPG